MKRDEKIKAILNDEFIGVDIANKPDVMIVGNWPDERSVFREMYDRAKGDPQREIQRHTEGVWVDIPEQPHTMPDQE